MRAIKQRALYGSAATAIVWLACPAAKAEQAQPAAGPDSRLERPVDIQYRQVSMPSILRDLSERYGVSIIADGMPMKAAADVVFSGTVRKALDVVGQTFGYTVTVGKYGAVTMLKSFKDAEDRPQLVPEELRQTAEDMLKILPVLPYDPKEPSPWVQPLRQLAGALSPQQVDAMRQGRALAITDLPPDQQTALARIVLLRSYGDARTVWQRLALRLTGFGASEIRVEKQGVFRPEAGHATAYFQVVHETKGAGAVTKTPLGGFRREVKP